MNNNKNDMRRARSRFILPEIIDFRKQKRGAAFRLYGLRLYLLRTYRIQGKLMTGINL